MKDYFVDPKMKVDPMLLKQLNEVPGSRYSFVCNAIEVCNTVSDASSNAADAERLHNIAALCAEMTARCNALSTEWLGEYSTKSYNL